MLPPSVRSRYTQIECCVVIRAVPQQGRVVPDLACCGRCVDGRFGGGGDCYGTTPIERCRTWLCSKRRSGLGKRGVTAPTLDRIEVAMAEESTQADHPPRCSFCFKSQTEVEHLVCNVPRTDQPRVYICNECILVCRSILGDSLKVTHPAKPQSLDTGVQES